MIGSRTIEYIIAAQDQATRTLNKIDSALAANEKSFQRVREAGMTLAVVGAAATAAVLGLANSAGRVEQLNVAFTTMLGSAEAAHETIEELQQFASKTPFTLPGVERSAQQLLAVGFTAEELIPTLKMVGDVASGLSLGEDGLQRLIVNLGQVKTQGHLTGRELRDFAVNGVPLIEGLATSLGVTKERISELTSEGAISERMVTQAFTKMTQEGGRFANMMDKQSKTFIGATSNMKDSLTILGRTLGQPLIGPLTRAAQKVAELATAIGEFVKRNPLIADLAAKGLMATAAIASLSGAAMLAAGSIKSLMAVVVVLNGGLQVLVGVITELRIAAMYGAAGLKLAVGAMTSLIAVAGAAVIALGAVLYVLNKIAGAQGAASAAISAEYDKQIAGANELAKASENLSGRAKTAAELQTQAKLDNAKVQELIANKQAFIEAQGTFQLIGNKKKEIAALDEGIAKAEEASARSTRAALDFARANKGSSEQVTAALDQIRAGTTDVETAFGDMGDKGEEETSKIVKAIEGMEEAYSTNVGDINKELADLEREHGVTMKKLGEQMADVESNITDLRDAYASAMADINGDIAGAFVNQETMVAELQQKMEQFKLDPSAMGADQMVMVLENRMDKLGIFVDKLSARDIKAFNLSDESVNQIETLLELRSAEAALQRIQEQGVATTDALAEARRRATLSENERTIEDALKKAEEEDAQFKKKMDQYLQEQTELQNQQKLQQEVYEAQRGQLQLTLLKMEALHAGYVNLLSDMNTVTEDKVNAMKAKLEELKETIAAINSLLQSQGQAGIGVSSSLSGSTERGLERSNRAMGGFAGGLTWVGERGAELLNLPEGSHVMESGASRRLASSDGGGGSIVLQGPLMQGVTITNGMDVKEVVRLAMDEMTRQVRLKRIKAA